jgi:cytochrome P450
MTESLATDPVDRTHHHLDISSWDFWLRPFEERDERFAQLRAAPEITWHAPLPTYNEHEEPGFWALTRIEDIEYVSKNPDLFASRFGNAVDPYPAADNAEDVGFIIAMDAPRHGTYRRLVSAAFTPKAVARLKDHIELGARQIVDDLVGAGEVDFVSACSARLPMRTVSDLVGIPEDQREAVAHAAETLFSLSDPETIGDRDPAQVAQEQMAFLRNAAMEVAADRRLRPRDDLMTAIVQAEVDGKQLTDKEIGAFMVLLATAGNDTTKQTTSHAMVQLARNPDQRAWLLEDFEGRINTAVEEFVRHASPVMAFSRRVMEDTEIRGTRVRAGDKVAMFYCSANRDESRFPNPGDFDLSRFPNLHAGFGGGGAHYCLGNAVAKIQLRSIFRELLFRAPHAQVGDPSILPSRFVHAVKKLPVTF